MRTTKSDRFVHFNRFTDYVMRHLRPAEVKIWVYLWRRANRSGQVAISYASLGKAVGVDRKNVRTACQRLVRFGCLGMDKGTNWKRHRFTVKVTPQWETHVHPDCQRKDQTTR